MDKDKTDKTGSGLAVDSASAGYLCPTCGGNLYENEADEGPRWYECDKCDFECDSDFNRETGDIFPAFLSDNTEIAHSEQTENNYG
jgi:predicted RNA-binding Zn-ribbon protein involved in translation (DUF1610 family)